MRNLFKFDARSLLLVLAAFIGNAQAMGIDLVLILVPAIWVLQIRDSFKLRMNGPLRLFAAILLLAIAALRAPQIGVPYFDDYSLWPVKALCLMLLVVLGKDLRWPMGNFLVLAFICVLLIAVGRIESGRLVSVFGPNMLYRIFGLLLFFSIMHNFEERKANRLLILGLSCIGFYASLLTGSSGALIVIFAIFAITAWRISKPFSIIFGGVFAYGLYWFLNESLNRDNYFLNNTLAIFSRLSHKISSSQNSYRLTSWMEFMSEPLTVFGYEYSDFSDVWVYQHQYPHNIIVELIVFYGALGVILSMVSTFSLIKSISLSSRGNIISMTYIVLFISASLSGDLSENYAVIALSFVIFIQSTRATFDKLNYRGV